MTTIDYGPRLAPQHVALLQGSAISVAVALERGYVTATTKKAMAERGFGETQQRPPALLVPLFGVRGDHVGFQARPDDPRWLKDRKIKYETPFGKKMVLDCHPSMWRLLGDPSKPLIVTEGVRKGDAAVSAWGVPTISLLGVWNWRGANDDGGKTALADWESVALNDRDVIVTFDSDVMNKKEVRAAMTRMGAFLANRGASVHYAYLPDGDNGEKVGLDDWIASGKRTFQDLCGLCEDTPRSVSLSSLPETAAHPAHPPTPAPMLAFEPRILDRFGVEIRKRKLVGEERNAKLVYLALTSRLLPKPVSVGVKGHSASGKSYLVEQTTCFFPADAVVTFTAMSEKALIYSKREYRHRTIVIYELTGLRENDPASIMAYVLRSLLSEGRIEYETTVKGEDGGFETVVITKEGPTNLIFTTTQTRIHAENETRSLSLYTNDSTEQTERVIRALADESLPDGDLSQWQQLQEWLAEGECRVTIPFAGALNELIPPVAVRLRRDVSALLSLIRSHALLHRAGRDRDCTGAVVATIDDYAVVRSLVSETMATGVEKTVTDTVRETVNAVAKLIDTHPGGVPAKAVAALLGVDRSNASRRLKVAEDGGYVVNDSTEGAKKFWKVGDALPEEFELLPDPDVVDCAVWAPVFQEEESETLPPPSAEELKAARKAAFDAESRRTA